ncbi:ABC transporter ATP-binding protein [Pedobacter sp. KBW06]|uniref:peptidase domain-containing ABC transporter n=1 Tax=Pedobacter sp. KBW06 TaxID=2153359 RepID=UPI000F58FE5C|nr:peptidase domain-containing ABC transporter [Pedobacter sp. KBW06]RQO70516.1 ABC transporter ATP-binding protein [Pedobacter sp. KBW06]
MSPIFSFGRFPFYKQPDAMDCGPVCLKIVTEYYGKTFPLAHFRKLCSIGKQGTTMANMIAASKSLGFKTLAAELPYLQLRNKVPLPCILHWEKEHYVVLYRITDKYAWLSDPAMTGRLKVKTKDFIQSWQIEEGSDLGRALLLETTPVFQEQQSVAEKPASLWSLLPYLRLHRKSLIPIGLSLILASVFSLIIPLLTQLIVDKGINGKNTNLLFLICIGQLMLFSGRMLMDFLRARLLFRLGARTSITLLKEFLAKLMQLPFSFFDNRQAGDNMQRVNDNQRVEEFLTNSLISFILSLITLVVLGGVLCYYNWQIFLIFLAGASLSVLWSNSFKQKRKLIDQKKFKVLSANQQLLLEIFYAMQEIKLTGSEKEKQQLWEGLQDRSYGLKLEALQLDQLMQGIGYFINEVKNVLITYAAAMLVINNEVTLGGMLAITYICGQLNTPITQLVEFARVSQNTKFSLQRMAEVQQEIPEDFGLIAQPIPSKPEDILLKQVSFQYGNPQAPFVLKNLDLLIPAGKVTAIVGMSGSGKTTLIKLLLKFYQASKGSINIGNRSIDQVQARAWRAACGVVMQDGYIFMDTIANNIYAGALVKNEKRLHEVAGMANMHDFFSAMPFGYQTVVGKDGYGLSEGQKQRLLIARLIYRNPAYVFLDEATNALDAHNELSIVNNLNEFFKGKTVLIVAHRLSTVKNADQIVVLNQGELVEKGTHQELIQLKGSYYHLIKNQLELSK